jgi:hypothetical protein
MGRIASSTQAPCLTSTQDRLARRTASPRSDMGGELRRGRGARRSRSPDKSGLDKVMIRGQHLQQPEFAHHDEACAVSEREVLVATPEQQGTRLVGPRQADVFPAYARTGIHLLPPRLRIINGVLGTSPANAPDRGATTYESVGAGEHMKNVVLTVGPGKLAQWSGKMLKWGKGSSAGAVEGGAASTSTKSVLDPLAKTGVDPLARTAVGAHPSTAANAAFAQADAIWITRYGTRPPGSL